MIGDYLKSPEYYKKKHVDKLIPPHETSQMQLGSAVDCIVTEGMSEFNKRYALKVLKRDAPELFEENKSSNKVILSEENWLKAGKMAEVAMRQPAYQWLVKNKCVMQPILQGEIDGIKVKGRPDFLTVIGDTAYIDDLKTTSSVNEKKYMFHSFEFGYFRQACMYKELVLQSYPAVRLVVNRHLVITRGTDIYDVEVFLLDGNRVNKEMITIKLVLEQIKRENFEPKLRKWEDARVIGTEKQFGEYELLEL